MLRRRTRSWLAQGRAARAIKDDDPTREMFAVWLKKRGLRPRLAVPSRSQLGDHVTTLQYGPLVDDWVELHHHEGHDPIAVPRARAVQSCGRAGERQSMAAGGRSGF